MLFRLRLWITETDRPGLAALMSLIMGESARRPSFQGQRKRNATFGRFLHDGLVGPPEPARDPCERVAFGH